MIKNKILLILLLLMPLTLYPAGLSLAYEESTHIDLTKKIAEIYNKYNEPKITAEQLSWMIDGSAKEDTAPRWINHFYDPIYKNGWSGEKEGDVSKETINALSRILISTSDAASSLNWLHNEALQQKYGLYEGNQTYEKALNAYAYSQNQKNGIFLEIPNGMSFRNSFKALGHIMHLLEDLGVPAHTRNDTHADAIASNDGGDPYEKWASQSGNDNLSLLNNINPNFSCNNIDDCFIKLATYANENFYSKDTVDDLKYKILTADLKKDINSDEFLVFRKDIFGNNYPFKAYSRKIDKFIIEDNQIHQAYWDLLSKQIVSAGVEALKIFYSDAQKETENLQYQPHAVAVGKCDIPFVCADTIVSPFGEFSKLGNAADSFISNVASVAKNVLASAGNLMASIFRDNNDLKQISQVDLSAQSDKNVNSNQISGAASSAVNKNLQKQNEVQSLNDQIKDLKKEVASLNKELNKQTGNPVQNTIFIQNDATSTAAGNNMQKTAAKTAAADFCKFSTSQQPKHSGVIINEIAWMGSIKNTADEWIELKNISGAEADLSGWQLISKDSQIKVNFGDLKDQKIGAGSYILLERTDDNTVLGIPADIIYKGGLSNTDEKLRLFDQNCNLIDEAAANPDWAAGDAVSKKTMERNTDGSGASLSNQFGWHTSISAGGTPKANNSLQQFSGSGGGGGGGGVSSAGNSQQQTAVAQEDPKFYEITINEIVYNPAGDDSGREWIEIFNKSASTVDLTGFKLSEDGTNHGLTLKQGDKNLVSGGYAILASDKDKFLVDYPDYSGNIFESPFSLNNSGEILILKNADLKIDEVSYVSSTGAYDNKKSLQLIDGEWRESEPTPGKINTQFSGGFSAVFSFYPFLPKENEEINFDAASSTSGTGGISLYEWQFGDNTIATSTMPQTTHKFKISGTYNTQLIIYNGAASSTTSAQINVEAQSQQGNGHVLISEIMAGSGSGKADEEFVELYNPTGNQIDLSGYLLKRKSSAAATSTTILASAGAFNGKIISANGFLLVGSQTYQGSKIPDVKYSQSSNHLAYDDDVVILYNGTNVIDEAGYQNIAEGQSLERKAFNNNSCISGQGDGEFLGNGCDTGDSANDFEMRTIPNPQNFENFPEPRNAPSQVQNFNIQYDATSTRLVFSWDASSDYSGSTSGVNYKIIDISSSANKLQNIETSSTMASVSISETGRTGDNNYKFSIQPFDSEGLGGTTSTSATDVPAPVIIYLYNPILGSENSTGYDNPFFRPAVQTFIATDSGNLKAIRNKFRCYFHDLDNYADNCGGVFYTQVNVYENDDLIASYTDPLETRLPMRFNLEPTFTFATTTPIIAGHTYIVKTWTTDPVYYRQGGYMYKFNNSDGGDYLQAINEQ